MRLARINALRQQVGTSATSRLGCLGRTKPCCACLAAKTSGATVFRQHASCSSFCATVRLCSRSVLQACRLELEMSKTMHSSLTSEPHLLDVVDDEWMQDVLANDGGRLIGRKALSGSSAKPDPD